MDYLLEYKVRKYIKSYFKGDCTNAGEILLENIELNGRQFLKIAKDSLEELAEDIEKEKYDLKEQYEKRISELQENSTESTEIYEKKLENIEKLIQGKEGTTLDKIKKILEED